MKNKITTLFSALLVFLLGCSANIGGIDIGKIATTSTKVLVGTELSYEEQQSIGEQMAAIVVGSSQVHQNQNLQKYVNKVGRWVATHAATENQGKTDWQFVVIDTPDFNAFSMPGGYVIVSSGAIDRLSSEAELAALLAHEIVHVEQEHQVKAIEKSQRFANLGELAVIAGDSYQANKGGYDSTSLAKRTIAKELIDVTNNLYTKGLGRDDELDADQKAVILMTRAGYDPYAYLTLLQVVESIDDDKKTLMLATHPKTSERIHIAFNAVNSVDKYLSKTKTAEKRFLKSVL